MHPANSLGSHIFFLLFTAANILIFLILQQCCILLWKIIRYKRERTNDNKTCEKVTSKFKQKKYMYEIYSIYHFNIDCPEPSGTNKSR